MKKNLGQIFTPKNIVKEMINLISIDNPKILEPSSGNGSFYFLLKEKYNEITSIEIDSKIAHKDSINIDFFDYDIENKFDVIIGNPPYVEMKKIDKNIFKKFKTETIHKPNLYMLFFEKSLKMLRDNGELIFIIPIEWTTSLSFSKIIENFREKFSIQFFKLISENIWENASITTAIIKIKKGNHEKIDYFFTKNGKLLFGKKPSIILNYKIEVKVGGASGNNSFFYKKNKGHNSFFVVSTTKKTKKMLKINYENNKKYWIRKVPEKPSWAKSQIFVNCITREEKPFFMLKKDFFYYDASILCIYSDLEYKDAIIIKDKLNDIHWKEMFIFRNGRYHFTQSILKGILDNG